MGHFLEPSREEGQRAGQYGESCEGTQKDLHPLGDKESSWRLDISSYL